VPPLLAKARGKIYTYFVSLRLMPLMSFCLGLLDLDPSAAITGTINSGDVIGVVSGLKEKIEAASRENITIPIIF